MGYRRGGRCGEHTSRKRRKRPKSLESPRDSSVGTALGLNGISTQGDFSIHDVIIIQNSEIVKQVTATGETRTRPFLVPRRSPVLPFIGRNKQLSKLKQRLFESKSTRAAIIHLPGVGKSALVRQLVEDKEVLKQFSDGVLWADLGRNPDVLVQLGRWTLALGIPANEIADLETVEERAMVIGEELSDRRMLLVIDDAWMVTDAEPFLLGGTDCAHVVTTRQVEIAVGVGDIEPISIPRLSEDEGVKLLRVHARKAVEAEPQMARELVQLVGGLPLALVLMANYLSIADIHGGPEEVRTTLRRLRDAKVRIEEVDQPQSRFEGFHGLSHDERLSLQAVFRVCEKELDGQEQQTLRKLSVFRPHPNTFSEDEAKAVTQASGTVLRRLRKHGLIEGVQERYWLQKVVADYARLDLEDEVVEKLHARAVTYYEDCLAKYDDEHEEKSSYQRWYRYEDAEWQDTNVAWLYHLSQLHDRAKACLSLAHLYFDAFWWWGWYTTFPFCERLLSDWDRTQTAPEDRKWLSFLRQFHESYPTGYSKHDKPGWDRVEESLHSVRRSGGLDADFSTLTVPNLRHLRAITDLFLAHAYRYRQVEDRRADKYYQEAYDLLEGLEGDEWNIPWILYEQSDLCLERGQLKEAVEKCRDLFMRAIESEEQLLERDCEVISNSYRVLGDVLWQTDDLDGAVRSYALAIVYAYVLQGVNGPDPYTLDFYREMKERALDHLEAVRNVRSRDEIVRIARYFRDFYPSHLRRTGDPQPPMSWEDILVESGDELEDHLFPIEPEEDRLDDSGYCEEYTGKVRAVVGEMADRIESAEEIVRRQYE